MSRIKTSIIGLLVGAVALLGGCSSVRLAYGNGPQLAWWWLDGYVDFSTEQTPRVALAETRPTFALFDGEPVYLPPDATLRAGKTRLKFVTTKGSTA